MAITTNTLERIICAKAVGVNFAKTALIGRQTFWHCDASRSRDLLGKVLNIDAASVNFSDGAFADELFRLLGANQLIIFDASDYEGCDHVHDFNYKFSSSEYSGCCSVLFDGGSLEHIFNTTVAISNFIELIQVGGTYLGVVPCNGWPGHGFYQFSPEFFYRALGEENGFENTSVTTYFERGSASPFDFPDPRKIGKRLEFSSDRPLSLFVQSKKIENCTIFGEFPQQSDYEYGSWKK